MPLVWLRVAVAFYAVGLVYSLLLLGKRGNLLAKVVEPAVGFGLIFHFVSLVEYTVLIGRLSWASIHYSESLLAFVAMVVFFIFFVGYRTTSLGIVIFPIVFRADLRLGGRTEAGDVYLTGACAAVGSSFTWS